jgi:hypothetical protein
MPPEPAHAAQQAAIARALWQPAPPEGLTAPDPDEIGRRFAVYRNNVRHSLIRALAAHVPVVEALVGRAFFAAMAQVYIPADLPRGPVLHEWGGGLPDFLDRFPPLAHLPWIGDVARLELARTRAAHAADATPLAPAALAGPDPATLRLALHLSVTLFRSDHPVVSIWAAHQPGAARGPLPPGPEHALIARQPDFAVLVAPLDPGTHAVLHALAAGAPLALAAAHSDPTQALTMLLRHGLIVDILSGDTA